jgi:hypothetical protein
MWMAASSHTVWFEQISGRSSVAIWRIDGTRVRLLTRPKKIGFEGAYVGRHLWELTCGVKVHLLRIDPDTGTSTAVGQFPRTANYCDASMTVADGDVFVLEGQKLYAYR